MDIPKFLLALAVIPLFIAACVGIFYVVDYATVSAGISDSIAGALEYLREPIQCARGFLNSLAGSPVPITIMIWVCLLYPFAKLGAHVVLAIYFYLMK